MRTEERWNIKIRPQIVKTFTPRIQRDLNAINFSEITEEIKSCFIHGDTHTGKTLLSIRMLLKEEKILYMQGVKKICLFISLPEFFRELQNTFNHPTITTDSVLQKCYDAHLLIIDELGAKKSSDWVLDMLYLIINYRCEYLKKTIITSNLQLDEISELYNDERIASRINREFAIFKKEKWIKK